MGQPSGYFVPNNAAKEDEVPAEVIALYFRRCSELHQRCWVFRSDVPKQLYQGVYVGVSL
jgi:hypothetical protein